MNATNLLWRRTRKLHSLSEYLQLLRDRHASSLICLPPCSLHLLYFMTPHLLHAQWNPDPAVNNPVFAGVPSRTPIMRVTDDGIMYF